MYFAFKNKTLLMGIENEIVLRPEEHEKPDVLHNYSKLLKIKNPAVTFSDSAKKGAYNSLSDAEYEKYLKIVKMFSVRFFKNKPDRNIFALMADMADYILQNEIAKQFGKEKEELPFG